MKENRPKAPLKLILASTSPYRKAQLAHLGLPFDCLAQSVDETPKADEPPLELALRLSQFKALSASSGCTQNSLIIAGDQCAAFGSRILGKPYTEQNAVAQLQACSGQQVIFYSGLCVLDNRTDQLTSVCVETRVTFRQLSDEEISNYISRESPLDCAGSFKCEGLGITLFESIQSDDPSALIGLPLIQLNKLLIRHGVNALCR